MAGLGKCVAFDLLAADLNEFTFRSIADESIVNTFLVSCNRCNRERVQSLFIQLSMVESISLRKIMIIASPFHFKNQIASGKFL